MSKLHSTVSSSEISLRKMSRRWDLSRLHRQINNSLRPFIESEVVSMAKEEERNLLIVLSQVLREIQLLKHEADCDSEDNIECSDPHFEDRHCLTMVIADLIHFLTVESQFVRHSTENLLVVFSELIASSGSNWNFFVRLLCVCLELAISNTLSNSLAPSTAGADESSCYISRFVVILRPKLTNAIWFTVSSIIQVLRNILKYLKQEYDDQLLTAYLDCVSSCFSNIPWDLLSELHGDPNGDIQTICYEESLLHRNVSMAEFSMAFLGNLVQFFCSLVEQSGVEAAGGSPAEHQIVHKISSLFPEILYWCLGNLRDHNNMHISQYFRHKLLMLMIRLSSQICLKYSILVSWLQLLHKYFHDLLFQPITVLESGHDDCLEDSPFLLSLYGGQVNSMCTRHLQRQATFLFLRCSFSLISLKKEPDEQCACATQNSCSPLDLNLDQECCGRKKGLLELYEWLQGHLPSNMFVDHKNYLENCINFALSFLRLFMHEDDMLFEVLLQLFSIPYYAEQQFYKDKGTWKEVKADMLYHVSKCFDPVCLFHLFLAELLYDHQVLLDYLISKDTGIGCVKYLLRCLRTVCDSWHLFVEFSKGENLNPSSRKKRKIVLDVPNSRTELSSASDKRGDVVALSLEEVCNREPKHGSKCYTTRGQPFNQAKECLLSLKSSVESLHKRNLFPYNPEVLLRRWEYQIKNGVSLTKNGKMRDCWPERVGDPVDLCKLYKLMEMTVKAVTYKTGKVTRLPALSLRLFNLIAVSLRLLA